MPDDPSTDSKMTTSQPLDPVPVTVIGTGAAKERYLPTGTVAETPSPAQPNLVVTVVTPLMAVTVRFVNAFLTTLFGLVTAAMVTNDITAVDFWHLILKCATLSVAGAGVGLIKDLITIFGQLEKRYPLLSGSV